MGEELLKNWGMGLETWQVLETLLTDLKSLLRSMPAGDVMCMAKKATLTHDRPLPFLCSHCNYWENVMEQKL